MAGANSNVQITDLDFNLIKNNIKTFMQSQTVLQDYNFDGSALSTLLDVLAYNTQYQAYYLNMVANEMFLDTAIQRDSVVSHAKLLDYVPKSAIAPSAVIDLVVNNVTVPSLILPKFTRFISNPIDGVNYTFVTTDSYSVNTNTAANTATFNSVTLKQGLDTAINFTVDSTQNPTYTFKIPDLNVDTTTLQVTVQQSSSNAAIQVFSPSTSYLTLDGTSTVYFLQEGQGGYYEIYFGDGILGQQLVDGNVVNISYIVTNGTSGAGANIFKLMDTIGGYSNVTVNTISPASQGSAQESIESIKYQAPKSYAAQGRAVTNQDYQTIIQQNSLGFSFDAVSVWGGEKNNPPVYGQVFVAVKPTGALTLTSVQKTRLIDEVIAPASMITITPQIVDPDYVYLKVTTNVLINAKRTNLTASQVQAKIQAAVAAYGRANLNTFNSTFSLSDLILAIKNSDPSIVANEVQVQLQKKFTPSLTNSQTYKLYFGSQLQKGVYLSGISSSPSMTFLDLATQTTPVDGIYLQELPTDVGGVQYISLIYPGYSYQYPPIVTIQGDGTGATAEAVISNGSIIYINVLTPGINYTSASVLITPQPNDTTGQGAFAVPSLIGATGTVQSFYFNIDNAKTIFNPNVGSIDYLNGVVTLSAFNPVQVSNPLGQLIVTANPYSTIISSSYDRIITIDEQDPSAITVNVTVQ
jgi:hypothetical protein